MSRSLLETITEVFKPQAPLWACEFTSQHVIVAGVNSRRNRIAGKSVAAVREAQARAERERDSAKPQTMPEAVIDDRLGRSQTAATVRECLDRAGFKSSEIAVVIPDETARVAFVTAENPSKNPQEQRTFIRWKLKKTIPFDVDTAEVAYRMLGPHRAGPGVDLLVVLSPRSIVEQYEALFEAMDIHAGMVLPSTFAALNLFQAPNGDTLFLKVAPDSITTTIFQDRRVQFYRRVTDVSLYDAVYPTVMYYQDKLGGTSLQHLYVCGYDSDLGVSLEELREKLGLVAERMEPKSVDDMFKPALGAIHLKPEGVI